MKKLITYCFVGLILFSACKKNGCTDPIAVNYNTNANKDDGNCKYEIYYKEINKENVFLTDLNAIQTSNDPISNHIDSILSGQINTSVISTGELYLDLDQNEIADLYFEIIDLNLFNINNLPTSFDSLAARAMSTSIEFLDNSTWHYADALNENDVINSSAHWSSNSVVLGTFANSGQFNGKGQKYLGFRIPDGSNYKYGWIKLKCSEHNDTLIIYDYAYNIIPNIQICAGQQN